MKKILTIVMILFLALPLIACSNSDPAPEDVNPEDEAPIEEPEKNQSENEDEEGSGEEEPVENNNNENQENGKQIISLYFVNDHYMETGDESLDHMIIEEREIDSTTGSLEEAIVEELMEGPEVANASTTIPQSANLLGVEVRDGTAFVNFAREGMHGGSSQEGFTITQILSSLGQLDHIDRVQFLIDGEIEESLMGHITIDEPFEVEN